MHIEFESLTSPDVITHEELSSLIGTQLARPPVQEETD